MGVGMLFNVLLGLGLLALTVVGVIFAIRSLTPASRDRSKAEALETVRMRYARGEISSEEFDRLRRELG